MPYDKEIAIRMCKLIACTPKTMQQICDYDDSFPSSTTLYMWLSDSTEFTGMYLEAKRRQVAVYVDQTYTLGENADGDSPSQIAKAKMNIDLRKWHAARLAPRLYGDRSFVETTDGDNVAVQRAARALERLGIIDEKEY